MKKSQRFIHVCQLYWLQMQSEAGYKRQILGIRQTVDYVLARILGSDLSNEVIRKIGDICIDSREILDTTS